MFKCSFLGPEEFRRLLLDGADPQNAWTLDDDKDLVHLVNEVRIWP